MTSDPVNRLTPANSGLLQEGGVGKAEHAWLAGKLPRHFPRNRSAEKQRSMDGR